MCLRLNSRQSPAHHESYRAGSARGWSVVICSAGWRRVEVRVETAPQPHKPTRRQRLVT